jgi:hypothetical protein
MSFASHPLLRPASQPAAEASAGYPTPPRAKNQALQAPTPEALDGIQTKDYILTW